jgi:hypothetical protein
VHKYAQRPLAHKYNFGGRYVFVSTSASATMSSNCSALKRKIVCHGSVSRNKRPEPKFDLKHKPNGKLQIGRSQWYGEFV